MLESTDEMKIYMSNGNFPTQKGKIQQKYNQAFHHLDRCVTPGVTGGRARPGRRAASAFAPPPTPVPFSLPQCRASSCSCVMGAGSYWPAQPSAVRTRCCLRPWEAGGRGRQRNSPLEKNCTRGGKKEEVQLLQKVFTARRSTVVFH